MTKLNKKGKIIISLSAVGLVIILVGVWLLVGFFVPPRQYKLIAKLQEPVNYEYATPFDEIEKFNVGDIVRITTNLYNNKGFFYQKILYADNGPVYCYVTIQTSSGTKTETIKLVTLPEYLNNGTNKFVENIPSTTIGIEKIDDNGYNYQYGTTRQADYEFTETGTYTFTCYAAFIQCGQSFYVEMTPVGSMTVTVE